MTLSLLSNSSDRFPVVLVSPRLRRSNASLERLLDGSWYAAAPTSSREALLMPQCRLRSARRGCVEGALHGLEDSPYPARIRKAPPTSQGAQSPGRRIAGGKGMCARRAHHAPPARRCPSTIARFAMGFSGSNRRAGTIADGTARVPPPGRGPSADFPRAVETGDADTSAWAGIAAGCADRPGAHRDGPADGRDGRVSGDRRHPRQDRVPSREGRRQRIRRATRRAVGTRADRSAERIRHAPAVKTRSAVSGPDGAFSDGALQVVRIVVSRLLRPLRNPCIGIGRALEPLDVADADVAVAGGPRLRAFLMELAAEVGARRRRGRTLDGEE